MLGRVVDSFGRPLDGGPAIEPDRICPVNAPPPPAFARRPIVKQLATGVRVLDAMLPLGVGQRMGIFAGAGVGKSTLLGMICRTAQADVNVVGLIGERGRELNDFIRASLGPQGLSKSVVVAATTPVSAPCKVRSTSSCEADCTSPIAPMTTAAAIMARSTINRRP